MLKLITFILIFIYIKSCLTNSTVSLKGDRYFLITVQIIS